MLGRETDGIEREPEVALGLESGAERVHEGKVERGDAGFRAVEGSGDHGAAGAGRPGRP